MSRAPLLSVQGLHLRVVRNGDMVPVLRGVDLTIDRGEFAALVGESGSGKSLTALAILNLLPSNATLMDGLVQLDGVDLLGASESRWNEVRGRRVAMVFQEPAAALNPVLTVGFQIVESLRPEGASRRQLHAEAKRLLELVEMPAAAAKLGSYPHQLSGGQRQRVLIAMALARKPELLIADEPTSSLDVTVQAQILDLLEELRSHLGLAVMLITHDLSVAWEICDRIHVMYAGQIVEEAPTARLLSAPAHPYTRGLVASIPTVDGSAAGAPAPSLPGQAPEPGHLPRGCSFYPRCAEALDHCESSRPALVQIEPGQQARCLLYDGASSPEIAR